MTTPNLSLQNWEDNIEQPNVPFNLNAAVMDALVQGAVESVEDDAPTTVLGDAGKMWIVGSGTWPATPTLPAENDVAYCTAANVFMYLTPNAGWNLFDKDSGNRLEYDGTVWATATTPPGAIAADDVSYDNTASGLAADDVQAAIDELAAATVGAGTAPVVTLSGTTYTLDDLTNGAWHIFSNAGLVTITVMNDATEAVAANAEFGLDASGAAGVEIVSDDLAVILPPKGGTLVLEEDDFAVLKRRAADDYRLVGSTEAAP